MTKLPLIETSRLLLREIDYSDCQDLFEYARHPNVGPMAGWEPHRNIYDTRKVIQSFFEKKRYGQPGVYAIILKSETKMIGTIELHTYIPGFKCELGYTVSPYYWGKGYATEASIEVMRYGFTILGLKRIECATYMNNEKSRRVCEKLGLTFEGIKKNGYLSYDGVIHDVYAYSMTDQEFMQKHGWN